MNSPKNTIVIDGLLPPYVLESWTPTLLNPKSARYSLTFACDAVLEPTDRLSAKWQGAPGTPPEGTYSSDFVEVGDRRPVVLPIPYSLAAINQGRTVTLTYQIIRGSSPTVTSLPQILYVLPLAQADLPRVMIVQADEEGRGLDLSVKDLAQFTLRIDAWPLIMQGHFFWARLKGTNADGSVFDQQYWRAPESVVDLDFFRFGFFAQDFPAAVLQGLKDRSVLTVEFSASLDASEEETDAVVFAPRHYIVSTATPPLPDKPEIVSVTDAAGQAIADGGETAHTRVTISGTAMPDEQVEVFDGSDSKGPVRAGSGIWSLCLSELAVGAHSFTAKALYGDGHITDPWAISVKPVVSGQLSIEEAPDNVSLDPLRALTSLTAVLDYDMRPTDRISVTVTAAEGTPAAGSHTTAPVVAGTTRPRRITLPKALVAYSIGKSMAVNFTYTRDGSLPVALPPLRLDVLPIAMDRLPAPVITQANGTEFLNLSDVQSGATLFFGDWPHIAMYQRLHLVLQGQKVDGPHDLQFWAGNSIVPRSWVENGSYSVTIAARYLRQLSENSKLVIRFSVNLDQVPDPEKATVFQTREYTIRGVPLNQ
ncbi:Uncharacterised protein [Pseudomonas fluorescens]|uniref:Bacterial Ig-like domain-containing protein n=1 Tax=Pseudomonas fluorescens TaxID=294 RepID=A0A448DUA3_PSEFL|nr:hypothetical protein [Pseudomonas fluorescens]VEF10352.1 Uncharacterised protein [Pseudomonas fluorescens]